MSFHAVCAPIRVARCVGKTGLPTRGGCTVLPPRTTARARLIGTDTMSRMQRAASAPWRASARLPTTVPASRGLATDKKWAARWAKAWKPGNAVEAQVSSELDLSQRARQLGASLTNSEIAALAHEVHVRDSIRPHGMEYKPARSHDPCVTREAVDESPLPHALRYHIYRWTVRWSACRVLRRDSSSPRRRSEATPPTRRAVTTTAAPRALSRGRRPARAGTSVCVARPPPGALRDVRVWIIRSFVPTRVVTQADIHGDGDGHITAAEYHAYVRKRIETNAELEMLNEVRARMTGMGTMRCSK